MTFISLPMPPTSRNNSISFPPPLYLLPNPCNFISLSPPESLLFLSPPFLVLPIQRILKFEVLVLPSRFEVLVLPSPRLRYADQHLRQQRALLQQFGVMQHAWRPQRGLPERFVSILRAWLFEHLLHLFPKESEKIMLAKETGLDQKSGCKLVY